MMHQAAVPMPTSEDAFPEPNDEAEHTPGNVVPKGQPVALEGSPKSPSDATGLREKQEGEMFRLLVENVKDYAIFLIDTDARMVTWSKGGERLLGFTENEMIGQKLDIIFTPEDRAGGQPIKEMRQAVEKGRGEDDRWHIRKDGSHFWCSGVMTPLMDEGGKLRGFAKIMRDLTEKKLAEDKLKESETRLSESNTQKDHFLAVLSHELRNPLASIQNIANILSHQLRAESQLQGACSMMQRQLGVMTRLINDLLDTARITSGKLELRKELVDVKAMVERAVEAARSLIASSNHQLTTTFPGEAIRVHADPVRFEQVIVNLLTNAAKYTEEDGKITLTVEREEGRVAVRVKDTGIGIAPEMLPKVFKMFSQADTALHRKQSGLGIGLSLVKNLVELHGGTVEAHSPGVGRGSEFVVYLPLVSPKGTGAEEPKKVEQPEPSPRRRVLVVDDNVDAADSLAIPIHLNGHEVQVAHGGPEALEIVKVYRPEVAFLDIGMPGMDGHELARLLRKQPGLKDVVLVALTGWGSEEDRRRSAEAGFNHHLVKPPEPKMLESLLAGLKTAKA